ncbi:MAG TPA: hypothetical protein VEH78_00740 [Pseudolabrys sp.]|nr:hypothetical protein [Pseudolabrys sp.]
MPRYFFHFTDGRRKFTDSTGVELPGTAAVRQHAVEQIRELRGAMSEVKLQKWLGWKIIADDSAGNTVFEIDFDFTSLKTT